ncbi:MAG: sulfurtransferase-like selenium metabolism protein YedF [bacterium]|nr:sulfurtransferase-like selenium metabolism protein YedF [bacterium]
MRKAVIINSEFMGVGDEELGAKLMGPLLRKLWAAETKPEAILFYNSGVKLLAEGSPVLDALNGLFEAGVDLIACGTCCTYFGITERIVVGRINDMQEISEVMMTADSVVTI